MTAGERLRWVIGAVGAAHSAASPRQRSAPSGGREYPPIADYRRQLGALVDKGVRILAVHSGTHGANYNHADQLFELFPELRGRVDCAYCPDGEPHLHRARRPGRADRHRRRLDQRALPLMSVARQAGRGVAWNMLLGVSARMLQLVGTLILTRFIAPDEYGAVITASIAVMSAGVLTSFALRPVPDREEGAARGRVPGVRRARRSRRRRDGARLSSSRGPIGDALDTPHMGELPARLRRRAPARSRALRARAAADARAALSHHRRRQRRRRAGVHRCRAADGAPVGRRRHRLRRAGPRRAHGDAVLQAGAARRVPRCPRPFAWPTCATCSATAPRSRWRPWPIAPRRAGTT